MSDKEIAERVSNYILTTILDKIAENEIQVIDENTELEEFPL